MRRAGDFAWRASTTGGGIASVLNKDIHPPVQFDASQAGAVVMVELGGRTLRRLAFSLSARSPPHIRAARIAARERSTFALVAEAAEGRDPPEHVLADDVTPDGPGALMKLLKYCCAGTAVKAAALYYEFTSSVDVMLSHHREALNLAKAEITAALAAQGVEATPRTPASILLRARALLNMRELEVALRTPRLLPAELLRRITSNAHLLATGQIKPDSRPMPLDIAGLVASAGFVPRTRQTSGEAGAEPFPQRAVPEGHIPTLNVAALLKEIERVEGPLADADPLWTALHHLHSHHPVFSPELLALAAKSVGPLRLGKAGTERSEVPLPEPAHSKLLEQIAKWKSRGVIKELTPEQVADKEHCRVITAVGCVMKGPLDLDEAGKATVESAEPATIFALAAKKCADIIAQLEGDVHLGTDAPGAALQHVINGLKGEQKGRMVHDASPFKRGDAAAGLPPGGIHPFKFLFVTLEELLAKYAPGCYLAKCDAESYFYSIAYDDAAKPYLCFEYQGRVYRYERLSMGAPDSPGVASLLTAIISSLAAAEGFSVGGYVDDFMSVDQREADADGGIVCVKALFDIAKLGFNKDKHFTAAQTQEFLGKVVNSVAGTVSLPAKNQLKYMLHGLTVEALLSHHDPRMRREVTSASLDSLHGKLEWWATCCSPARPHLSGLYASKFLPTHETRRVAALENLKWWHKRWAAGTLPAERIINPENVVVRVTGGGGVTKDDGGGEQGGGDASDGGADEAGPPSPKRANSAPGANASASSGVTVVRSDAGEPSGGAYWDGRAVHHVWSAAEVGFNSDRKELKTVLFAARAGASSWRGKRVLFCTDNIGVFHQLLKGRANKSADAQEFLAEIFELSDKHEFYVQPVWIPREVNTVADELSKCTTGREAAGVCARESLTLTCV